MKSPFSINYFLSSQQQFVRALEEGYLEEAVSVLEKMPSGSSTLEKTQRLVVLYEGYKAIVKAYQEGTATERELKEELSGINEGLAELEQVVASVR